MESEAAPRKIIHIDMDAFFTSVEQRDDPALRGKPIIVGGSPQSRGVVAAASYEARRFGVRSAMSTAQAFRLCPHLILVAPHFEKYSEASHAIHEMFQEVTDQIEPLSLDEAYLDVTQNHLKEPLARVLAANLKRRIYKELHLTASAGVGPNKFIAKLASDFQKPNGLVVVPPERVFQFIEYLPIEKFWGVGPATAKRFHACGIKTAADIRASSLSMLQRAVGSSAQFFFDLAHGNDDREVQVDSEPKSRGSEMTFESDIQDPRKLLPWIDVQAKRVAQDLKRLDRLGRTVTLKIKYADFSLVTRSRTVVDPIDDPRRIAEIASALLFKAWDAHDVSSERVPTVRLIGVSVGHLVAPQDPLQLWFDFRLPGS